MICKIKKKKHTHQNNPVFKLLEVFSSLFDLFLDIEGPHYNVLLGWLHFLISPFDWKNATFLAFSTAAFFKKFSIIWTILEQNTIFWIMCPSSMQEHALLTEDAQPFLHFPLTLLHLLYDHCEHWLCSTITVVNYNKMELHIWLLLYTFTFCRSVKFHLLALTSLSTSFILECLLYGSHHLALLRPA